MEKFPMSNESMEGVSDWRELRKNAFTSADTYISKIDGFAEMDFKGKILALDTLIDQLSDSNENRYIAREVGIRREQMKEVLRHTERMLDLGATI